MSEFLGITSCDECGNRFKVLKKHQPLIGKAVKCPNCHSRFTLSLEKPSNLEEAAIASEEQQQEKPKRRSKDKIREDNITKVAEGVKALHSRLQAISQESKSSEEKIRVWCLDVLRKALGYDDSQLDTECRVMAGRVDIAIKEEGRITVVIECKNIRKKLDRSVREQAGSYAATLSAPWVVLTNGDIWKLYRVTPRIGQDPSMDQVFGVSLLDEDGISDSDAEHLYLLSHRALSIGDTEREYHDVRCVSSGRIYDALRSERVLNAIRLQLTESYRNDYDQRIKLTNEDTDQAVSDLLIPNDFG